MTTINFEEDIKINSSGKTINIEQFLKSLAENGQLPVITELHNDEITNEIQEAYTKSKSSHSRINI